MEPMTLGSPVGSPTQISSSPGNNSAYLPSFLLGDTNTPSRMSFVNPRDSSRYINTSMSSNMASPIPQYCGLEQRSNRQKAVFGSSTSPNVSQIGPESHAGGPPTLDLFDSLETSQSLLTSALSPHSNVINGSAHQSRLLINSTHNALFPEGLLPVGSHEPQGLLQWVTVFGFPPHALDTVLSNISSRVRIIDKHPAPSSQNNWIHIKCASEQEAQRALACNGSIISGTIMIGIIACTDEGVVLGCDKENRTMLNSSMRSFVSPGQSNSMLNYSSSRTPIKIQNARPLAVGFNQHLSPQSVRSPENVPQKSTGLVSKAMEYVFGW